MNSLSRSHAEKVSSIARQIKAAFQEKRKVKFLRPGVPHVVPLASRKSANSANTIDCSNLTEILEVNPADQTCVVEAGVSFRHLVQQTLKHNLVPGVVPELKGITVGGGIVGCSLESASFRYGGLHDTALEYEIITGAGEILRCALNENAHVFEMIHGSYGTLGLLTKVKLKLFPSQRYVRMGYKHFETYADFQTALQNECASKTADFIDGIIHSKNHYVLCLGYYSDTAPYVSKYDWLNIYYKSTRVLDEDFLTTEDYFFRYDAECHWLSKTFPPLEWKPFRLLFGKFFLGSDQMIKWAKRIEAFRPRSMRPDVICDVFIPVKNLEKFFKWYEEAFNYYPVWIVPYRAAKIYDWIHPEYREQMGRSATDNLLIDVAIYGKKNNEPDKDYSELLEKQTHAMNGIKTLISRNHYTLGDFWKVYNQELYQSIKREIDPGCLFSGLYEKMVLGTSTQSPQ